jgi:hypothetical protein
MIRLLHAFSFLIAASLATSASAQRAELSLHGWGLASASYKEVAGEERADRVDLFCDTEAFKAVCGRGRPPSRARAFISETGGSPLAQHCLRVSERIAASLNPTGGTAQQLAKMQDEKERSNPECVRFATDAAPQLYFDLVNNTRAQAILEEIRVTNHAYTAFAGGGFTYGKQTYDLWISTAPGTQTFTIRDDKLVLPAQGTGQLKTRLFSESVLGSIKGGVGATGLFLLDMEFAFALDGKRVRLKTPRFLITM